MESLRNQLTIWGHVCYHYEECHTPDRVPPGTLGLAHSSAVGRPGSGRGGSIRLKPDGVPTARKEPTVMGKEAKHRNKELGSKLPNIFMYRILP